MSLATPRWLSALLLPLALPALAARAPVYGPELQGFDYPYPLQHFSFVSQGQALQMGYMDVPPQSPANGRSLVLMHGKNFCGATWEGSIKALSAAGYRVIVPDQIGFCTSSKPEHYQYSFQQLAQNTHQLLAKLGVSQASLLGIPPVACWPPATPCNTPIRYGNWPWSTPSAWKTGKPWACPGAASTSGTSAS
ncbi:hypothetical protein PBOI14_36650 [Pseudomonas sp. Boi14]|nr:hypothetical protein PBOI14_36650 [Pseudomonas sp. Boi14]